MMRLRLLSIGRSDSSTLVPLAVIIAAGVAAVVNPASRMPMLALLTAALPLLVLGLMRSIERSTRWRDTDRRQLQLVRLVVVVPALAIGAIMLAWLYGQRDNLEDGVRLQLEFLLWFGVITHLPLLLATAAFVNELYETWRHPR